MPPTPGSQRFGTHRPASHTSSFHASARSSHYDAQRQAMYHAHIQRMVSSMMPYEPHPSTGFHPRVSTRSSIQEIMRLTGGWPLPGSAPANFALWWPRPRQSEVPVELAPLLVPNPLSAYKPLINWDMSQRPSTAQKVDSRRGKSYPFVGNELDLPATNPPSGNISIMCSVGIMGTRWGPISISRKVVTIWDVLDHVFEFLHTPLHPWEVYEIQRMQEAMNLPPHARLDTHSQIRLKRSSDISARPKVQYRRVDCLGEQRCFWGMWISCTADRKSVV